MPDVKINYHNMFEQEIKKASLSSKKPSLLLHACCAPCSSAVLEAVKDYFDVTLYFYNPNIEPEEEFVFRLNELHRLLEEMNLDRIRIVAPEYDNGEFKKISEGLENLPEGGKRCAGCYRLRLESAVSYAAVNKFDYVTTTLTVSPHKNSALLNETGRELGERYSVKYLFSDFKKKEGYKRSCELSKKFNLYRQNYCGCVFSKPDNDNGKETIED